MPYPKKLLNDYETVALDLHPHWWHFAKAALALFAFIVFGIVVQLVFEGETQDVLTWVALVGIIASAIWLLVRYSKWATTNFVITSDRIIYRSGVVGKRGIEIPLERVNNVHFSQSAFERMIGAGDLMMESGGESGQQKFTDIRNPGRVQNLIHSQMEVNAARQYGGAGAGGGVALQLEKLEGLLERGTITREEFDQEKNRLLSG